MQRRFWLFTIILVLLIVGTNPVLAKSREETSRNQLLEKIWQEVLKSDNLMDAKEFLEGEYSQSFWYKVFTFTHNEELKKKYLSSINEGSIFKQVQGLPLEHQRFIYAGYLGWYSEHRKNRMAQSNEIVAGNSEKYKIVVMPFPENDKYFRDKEAGLLPPALFKTTAKEAANRGGYFELGGYGESDFYPGRYNVDNNHLLIEERVLLPPALWLVFMHHEERHSFDDIVTYKNNPPRLPDKSKMLNFELQGYAAALFTWKLIYEEFMEGWERLGLDFSPDLLTSKLLLVEILLAEPLFDGYLLGQKSGLEKHIEEGME